MSLSIFLKVTTTTPSLTSDQAFFFFFLFRESTKDCLIAGCAFAIHLNSKNNGSELCHLKQYLGIKTIFCVFCNGWHSLPRSLFLDVTQLSLIWGSVA